MFCLCTPEYGTFHWSMVDLTGIISLNKWILLCQKSIAPQIGIGAHESLPPRAGMLTAFLVLWAHEWRDPVMSRKQGLALVLPDLWLLHTFLHPLPGCLSEPWRRHAVHIPGAAEPSAVLASEPVGSFWVSHHPWYKETSLMKYESCTNLSLGLLSPGSSVTSRTIGRKGTSHEPRP